MRPGSQTLARPSQSLSPHKPGQQPLRERTPEAAARPDSVIEMDVVAVGVGLRFLELEASAQVTPALHAAQLHPEAC